jgi:hypothetical protein
MATWRQLIKDELKTRGDSWDNIVSMTLTKAELDKKFDSGFGSINGISFTVWTKNRVYFPVVYDGAEWVGSVSRNPDGLPTEHIGG